MNHHKQQGMTLIEIMLVLAIGMGIIIGGLAMYRSASNSQDVNTAVRNLGAVTSAVRTMFATQGNYTDLDNDVAVRASGFPDQMDFGGGVIGHPWDNSGVTIRAENDPTSGATDGVFTVTFANVPTNACVQLGNQTYRTYLSLVINGGGGAAAPAAGVDGVAAISSDCAPALNSLTWTVQ